MSRIIVLVVITNANTSAQEKYYSRNDQWITTEFNMANITDIGLTLGITCWIASGFCPKAARTVSVFSRNLWWFHRSGGVDSEGHEFSQSGSDSNKFEHLVMLSAAHALRRSDARWPRAGIFQSKSILRSSSLHNFFLRKFRRKQRHQKCENGIRGIFWCLF